MLAGEGEAMEDDSELPTDPESLQVVIEESEAAVINIQESIEQENTKMEKYRVREREREIYIE